MAVIAPAAYASSSNSWGPAVNLGSVINTSGTEKAPTVSPDGNELYFFREEPGVGAFDLFVSLWSGTSWGTSTNAGLLAAVNRAGSNDLGPFVSRDGLKLYFSSNRPGGYGGYDLYYATRGAPGAAWGAPMNLGAAVNSAADSELGPSVSADEALIFFARGWPSGNETEENIFYSSKTNGSWNAPTKWEWNTPQIEDNPELSPDGAQLYLTIKDVSSGKQYYPDSADFDIYVSSYSNGRWNKPVNAGSGINGSGHDGNPALSADGKTLYFTSENRSDGAGGFDLYCSTKTASDWDAALRLSSSSAVTSLAYNNAHVLRAVGKTLHLVFSDAREGNAEVYYRRSDDAGATWGPERRVTSSAGISWFPSVAVGPDGTVHIVWDDDRSGTRTIYYRRSADGGASWDAETVISTGAGKAWYPDVAADAQGRVVAAWQDQRNGAGEIYLRRSLDGGKTWESELRLTNASYESERPTLSVDGKGRLHLAWYDWRDDPSRAEVYYAKSSDGGASWETQTRLTTNSGATSSGLPALASDGNDGLHLVYYHGTKLVSGDVYYLRSADGGASWASPTRLTGTATSSMFFPVVVAESSKTIHAAWQDLKNGNDDIYYRRSLDGGATWEAEERLTVEVSSSATPSLTAASGRLHMVWEDTRDGNREVYYSGKGSASVGTSSASAAAVPPAASPSPFLSVSTAGLTAAWLADGNSAGTTYYVQLSSTPGFSPVLQSTQILTLNAYFSGLSPNTSYYVQAAALSLKTSTWTAFAALGSTSTLAAPPAPAPPSSIGTSSVTANWSANGNAASTAYIAQISTDGFATVNASSRTLSASAAFFGLNANTTYYLQVQAVGNNGLATPFTALPSTMTLLVSPGLAGITFTTVGMSSITVNWTSGGNGPGTNYITQLSTDNFATINLSSNTLNLGALFGTGGAGLALTPNTTYYFRARAASGSNVSGFTSLGSTFTLAAPPAATAFSAVNITSATVNWSLNLNPVSTLAEVQRSSDNVVFASVFTGAALSFIDGGLLSCTTYYVRVRNWNGGGVATAFDGTAQFKTLASIPMAPGALAAVPIAGNRISLSWTASPTEDVTAYRLYSDGGTGVVDYAEPLAVLASTETSFTTGVLASSASYRFALRAKNRCGVEETGGVFASAASIGALSAVSSAVTAPQSGRRIAGDRVTLVAELVNGSAAQARSVLFQYKASASPAWLDVSTVTSNRTNPVFTAPYFAHWDVTGLPAASYDLRAVATSVDGVVDAAPPAVTVIVDPDGFDVREKLDGGRIRREHVVYNGAANVIQTADEGTLLTKITLPAGALDSASATLTVVGNSVLPGPAPSGWTDVAVKAQITLSNGQTILSGGQTAALTFHYPDANNDGAIDNTRFKAAALKLYGFDAAAGRWVQDLQSVVLDASARAISGGTRHFSFFAAFAPATAAGLDAVRVYPVPFKPYGLNADAGRPFASGNPDSGIVFDNLPTAVTIKIYTLTGRLVAQLSANDGAGRVQWNARNDSGAEAASGGYFAVIRSPGQDRVVKKLSIIR